MVSYLGAGVNPTAPLPTQLPAMTWENSRRKFEALGPCVGEKGKVLLGTPGSHSDVPRDPFGSALHCSFLPMLRPELSKFLSPGFSLSQP